MSQSIPLNIDKILFPHASCNDTKTTRLFEYNVHSEGQYIARNTDSMRTILSLMDSVDADLLFLPEYKASKVPALKDSLANRYG